MNRLDGKVAFLSGAARGITAVEPHPDGALVTNIVVNIAPGLGRWLAHFFQARDHRKRAARQAAT